MTLIDQQEAIDALRDEFKRTPTTAIRAMNVIRRLPSAQPNHNAEPGKMEIVHCENCEYWDTSWETVYGLHYCPMIDMATKKNFFCKYGAEKRGEA